jgi:hypothetical protein
MNNPFKPQTLAERLDAAQSGEKFAEVLEELFRVLERRAHDESGQPVD